MRIVQVPWVEVGSANRAPQLPSYCMYLPTWQRLTLGDTVIPAKDAQNTLIGTLTGPSAPLPEGPL